MLVQMPEKLIVDKATRLHIRMGHASKQNMIEMIRRGGVSDVTIEQVKAMEPNCPICTSAKLKSGPHRKKITNRPRATQFNARQHTDTMTRRVPSLQGNLYIQMTCDEATRWAACEFLKNRRPEEYQAALHRLESKLHAVSRGTHFALTTPGCSHGRPVGTWVADNAGEMVGASNRARLARANPPIALELTVPTAHAHGGIIERLNASILSLTRALLLESGLGIEFWQWAVRHAVLLYNYRPHSSNPDRKSPYEMLYHKTPPYHKLRAWGCVVFTYVPQAGRPNRSKVDPTAQPRIYLGVPDSGIGHLVHNLATGRTTHRWSCIFDETARGIDGSPMGRVTWPRAPGSGTSHTGDTTEEDTDDDQTDEDDGQAESDNSSCGDHESTHSEDVEIDEWNTLYKALENETMATIAENHDLNVGDLIEHNLGIPGCGKDGRVAANAPLVAGTGLWIRDPDDGEEADLVMGLRPSQGLCLGDFIVPGSDVDEQWKRECELGDIEQALLAKTSNTYGLPILVNGNHEVRARSDAISSMGDSWGDDTRDEQGSTKDGALVMEAKSSSESAEESQAAPDSDPAKAPESWEELWPSNPVNVALSVTNGEAVLPGTEGVMARDLLAPKSYNAAMRSQFAHLWQDSIAAEVANLQNEAVYSWCDKPANARCIGTTWAFKTKPTKNGYVAQLKSRICALGFLQRRGTDFLQSYAPVSTMVSWRCQMAEASRKGWLCDVVDIKSAFLQSELEPGTVVYIRPPKGVTDPSGKTGRVWILHKALYGLRQSAYVWNVKLNKVLTGMSFRRSEIDACLYTWNGPLDETIRLTVHVDDLCCVSNSKQAYTCFRNKLQEHFEIKSPSTSNGAVYLGVAIDRLADGSIQLSQGQYCRDMLARYNMTGCKPVNTPWQPGVRVGKEHCPKTEEERRDMERVPYLEAIGSLLWLAGGTRPDISYSVAHLARYSTNPGRAHWRQVQYLMRYLEGTQDLGIIYGRDAGGVPFVPLCTASDASWGDGPDRRSSCTGWVVFSAGGPISWSSTRMKSIALSTTEAEYHALCEAGRETTFVKRLLEHDCGYKDLSVKAHNDLAPNTFNGTKTLPVTILEDNTGAIALAGKRGSHKRSKHIDLKFHWIQKQVEDGQLLPVYVESAKNPADLLTKGVSRDTLERLRPMLLHEHEAAVVREPSKGHKTP